MSSATSLINLIITNFTMLILMMKPKDRGGSHLEADKIAPFSHWHWLASHLVFIIMIITVIMKMMKKL